MIVPLLGKGLAKYNTPNNRKIALSLAKMGAGAAARSVQRRRKARGKRVLFPGLGSTGTTVTQRSAAGMTVQTIKPLSLRVADTEQCTFEVPKADGSSLGMPVSPYTPLLWPKLSTKVSTYSNYRQLGNINVYYVPKVGTNYQGSIVMGFTKDVTTEQLSYQEISALPLSVSTPVAQNAVISIPVALTNQAVYKQMTVNPNNQTLEHTDVSSYLGLFHYSVDGTTGATTPGYFRVSYSFVLETPKMDVSPSATSVDYLTNPVSVVKCPQIYLKLDTNSMLGTMWSPTNVRVICILPATEPINLPIDLNDLRYPLNLVSLGTGRTVYQAVLPKGYFTVRFPLVSAAPGAKFWFHRTAEDADAPAL